MTVRVTRYPAPVGQTPLCGPCVRHHDAPDDDRGTVLVDAVLRVEGTGGADDFCARCGWQWLALPDAEWDIDRGGWHYLRRGECGR